VKIFRLVLFISFFLSLSPGFALATDNEKKEELRKIAKEAIMVSYTLGVVTSSEDTCIKTGRKTEERFTKEGRYSLFWEALNNLSIAACLQGYMDKLNRENNLPQLLKDIDSVVDKK